MKNLLLLSALVGGSLAAAPIPLAPDAKGFPEGWQSYGKGPGLTRFEKDLLRITDQSKVNEWGISRKLAVPAPGKYEITAEVSGKTAGGQMVLMADGKVIAAPFRKNQPVCSLAFTVQPNTKVLMLYFYGTYTGTPDFTLKNVDLHPAPVPVAAQAVRLTPFTADASGFPAGWRKYGKGPGTAAVEKGVIRIADKSTVNEWGIVRQISVSPGKYELTADVSGTGESGQMVVIVKGKAGSVPFVSSEDEIMPYRYNLTIPAGVHSFSLYFYGSYHGTPDFRIHNITLTPVKKFRTAEAGNEGVKVIDKLKNLYLETPLAKALIVPGDSPVLQAAAKRLAAKFGAKIVRPDDVKLPLKHHVIVLGNRISNPVIDALYKRGFCYTDKVYPGRGGYELRSIHNPTGNGWNVILCGGSYDAGAVEAARLLEQEPKVAGFLMKLKVPGFKKPFDAYDPDHYYLVGKGGYYGWNYLSGMLALFYQTGDTFYAKEFLRLAFPDAKAKKDFQKFNPESIELPDDPLAGPYHYCGHQMLLLWDLVEEHPVFTDKERLAVTNAFARQHKHHISWTRPAGKRLVTSSRHGQWSSICLFVLGRYFDRDYPAPVWKDALARAKADFRPVNLKDGWISGELGLTAWFCSGSVNPAGQYFMLTGGMDFNPEGAYANALNFVQTQWDGTGSSEIFGTAHRQAFYLAAEHTGDGKYLWFADLLKKYPQGKFKLGASFDPTGKIAKRAPAELADHWLAAPMKLGEHRYYGIKAPLKNCYLGLAWRDSLDTTGDWISFTCFNERYRTPFKLLSLSGLRLNGSLLLRGFGSYVQPLRNGTTEKEIPTTGEVYGYGNAGDSVFFAGGVPEHAYSAWRRDLLLRKRQFVLLADTVTPSGKGDDLTVTVNFQTASGMQSAAGNAQKLYFSGNAGKTAVRSMELAGKPACAISSGARNTLFETAKPGDRACITFRVPAEMTCDPILNLYNHNTRANTVNVYLDGKRILAGVQHYDASGDMPANPVPLGTQTLSAGKHTLEIEVASIAPGAAHAWIGAGSLALNANAGVVRNTLTGSAGKFVLRSGSDAALVRRIASDPKKPVTTFSLIMPETPGKPVEGITLDDRSALFLTPAPVLAFCVRRAGIGTGDLVLLEKDRIAGSGITELEGTLKAAAPVMIDWQFGKALNVSGPAGTDCTVNGKAYKLDATGRLTLKNIRPASAAKWTAALNARTADRTQTAAKRPAPAKAQLLADLRKPLKFIEPAASGYLAGSGRSLLVLDEKFKVTAEYSLSGDVLCAVQAKDLVIAGTLAEEVAAFDRAGKKVWSFTSVLAPEVEATQKYYWFKPAEPGVLSLAYRDGKVYAGSICTMEVLDAATGKLLTRYDQKWGRCIKTVFVNRPDGSYRTVTQHRRPAEGVTMYTIDNKTGKNTRSFNTNMPGYQHFPAWMSLYRTNVFAADFDGDGQEEVMADAEGMYTWLNVYREDGTPKYQVNLGPGGLEQRATVKNWTVGDVNGDRLPEALLVTTLNQLLAVSGTCRPLWSADLPFSALFIAVSPETRQIALAGGKQIALYDGTGKLLRYERISVNVSHLWSRNGVFHASGDGKIFKLFYCSGHR